MILVVAEHHGGQMHRATWEALAAGQALGLPISVVLAGHDVEALASQLAEAAVTQVLVASDPALANYTADVYVTALATVIPSAAPTLVLAAHTYQARDFMPMLASRLQRPMVPDCVALARDGDGVRFTRPMFQARLLADVQPAGPAPHLATLQIGAVRADSLQRGGAPAEVVAQAVAVSSSDVRQQPDAPFQEARQAVDLGAAERIVSVGRGIKGPEHLALVQELADALGAELAASRPICDNGWLPMDRQIGSSGQTVAPKLYLALGISGAIQHVVGIKGARTIVAINKDPDAPIFEIADYGITADLFEIVPALIAALKKP
ncbi:MAG: electron transfer flavoprotein subunit alpha/FixB family protein [Acidobacteria bacterium]|nr:electron transfer flavoprotein subunit alpha/FixB family protein [Acidobacteriota bacterium]